MAPKQTPTGGSEHAERDQETRRRILKAAEQLFLAKGFKGVSMKDIADEVQVTAAALYYHFPGGKRELFLYMVQTILDEMNQGAFLAISSATGIQEQLILLTQYLLALPFRNFYALARDFEEQFHSDPREHPLLIQKRGEFLQYIIEIFQQAIDAGDVASHFPTFALALMYQGMTMAIQYGHYCHSDELGIQELHELAQLIVDGFLYGVAAPETRP